MPPTAGSSWACRLARAHNDAALNPQVVVLVEPHLDLLSTLQKPENQVLQAGGQERGGSRAVPSAAADSEGLVVARRLP